MSFLETLRKNLTPELFTTITDALGDDFDYDLVPRTRLNKVIGQRNTLRDQLAGDPQPAAPTNPTPAVTPSNAATPTPEVDVEELKKQWKQEQDDAVAAVKIQYAALDKLRAAHAIDADLIWSAGLLDSTKLTLGEDGKTVQGLDEQITNLTTSKPHLFTQAVPSGTGKSGGTDDFGSVKTKEEFLKLPMDKQIAFKKANPTMFQSFLNS